MDAEICPICGESLASDEGESDEEEGDEDEEFQEPVEEEVKEEPQEEKKEPEDAVSLLPEPPKKRTVKKELRDPPKTRGKGKGGSK